jgi:hypothetical protein
MDMEAAAHQQFGNLVDDLVIGHPGERRCCAFALQQTSHGKHFKNVCFELPEFLTS